MTAPVILVVEDQALLRIDAMAMIEDAGFTVIGAQDAAAALRILEKRTDIQLVFTDIDMGKGPDGLWLAAFVRDRWPPIHIIVTSGHRRVTEDMLPEGALFVEKPYTEEQILTHVRHMIMPLHGRLTICATTVSRTHTRNKYSMIQCGEKSGSRSGFLHKASGTFQGNNEGLQALAPSSLPWRTAIKHAGR